MKKRKILIFLGILITVLYRIFICYCVFMIILTYAEGAIKEEDNTFFIEGNKLVTREGDEYIHSVNKLWRVDADESRDKLKIGKVLLENGHPCEGQPSVYLMYQNYPERLFLEVPVKDAIFIRADYDFSEISEDIVDAVGVHSEKREYILFDDTVIDTVFNIMSRQAVSIDDMGRTQRVCAVDLYEYDMGIPLEFPCSFEVKDGRYYLKCRREDDSAILGYTHIFYEVTEEEMNCVIDTVLKYGKEARYPSMLSK